MSLVASGYIFVQLSRASGETVTTTSGFKVPASPAPVEHGAKPYIWDPDTFQAPNGKEYTYFSSQPAGRDFCGSSNASMRVRVPVISHDANGLGGQCITADALPSGPGSWALADSDIWAPSIAYFSNTYFLYYSAQKEPGHWCIGVATSSSPLGPFANQREFACPDKGRWAIDPDVLIADNKVYLTYRDDAITVGNQTGISTVQIDGAGSAIWDTRKSVLFSTDIAWAYASRTATNVIENPSLVKWDDGHFYLFFSGNDFATSAYATGVADCGTTPLPATRCVPLNGSLQPYFGYSGVNPLRTLPGDNQGPGALSVYQSTSASSPYRASWHYRDAVGRRSTSGYALVKKNGVFEVQDCGTNCSPSPAIKQ